jgi:hypothetical protein
MAEPGHNGRVASGHPVAGQLGGCPRRLPGAHRGLIAPAPPAPQHDAASHHDQQGAQRNVDQEQLDHGQFPRQAVLLRPRTRPARPEPA